MGIYTIPVYEIYKAGSDLYWENGLDLLGELGLKIIIVTHWNNKEGGKDLDTKYCFMGEERFNKLLKLLPQNVSILGIDEHSAVIMDFEKEVLTVDGVGTATLIKNGNRKIFQKKNKYPLNIIR